MTEVVFDMNADTGDACVKGRVVRCRACVHYDSQEYPYGGWCSEWEGETEPDGFCHLGEEES